MPSSLRGILWMCLAAFCIAVGDAISKWLGSVYSPIQIIFFRALIAVPLIILIAHFDGGLYKLGTRHPGIHLLRGLIATATMLCLIFGLTMLPLAETTAIAFAAPLFVTALSVPLLGEKIKRLPLIATIAGFLGVVIIVRPGAAGIHPGAFVVMGAALCYALLMITARRYGASEHLWAMVFYVTLIPMLVTGAMLPMVWQAPQPVHWLGFISAGIFIVAAMACITLAFRDTPATLAAPFDYTGLIWALLFGWWFWIEIPDAWMILGASLIIGSGLVIAYHERYITLRNRKVVAPSSASLCNTVGCEDKPDEARARKS